MRELRKRVEPVGKNLSEKLIFHPESPHWQPVRSVLSKAQRPAPARQSTCTSKPAMPWKHAPLFRIGTLLLAFTAILAAQIGMRPKLPLPRTYKPPTCTNCVRDLSGRISQNPTAVRAFRAKHPCPSTGSVHGACDGYVVNHRKPLDSGGTDTPDNLRWVSIAKATKRRAE
jgi:hypothetical protein